MKSVSSGVFAVALSIGFWGSSVAANFEYETLMAKCAGISSAKQCFEAIEVAQANGSNRNRFSRNGERIVVKTQRTAVRLTNVDAQGPEALSYTYFTFLRLPRLHVVMALYWEGSEYVVINDLTGDTWRLQGFPVPSPNGTRVVATSASGESGYQANSVEVWSTNLGTRREFKYTPDAEAWEPEDAEWTNSLTIRVRGTCAPRTESAKPCPKLLTKTKGRWLISNDA